MDNNWIISAQTTVKVSEDKWERITKHVKVSGYTTVAEIDRWLTKSGLDLDTVQMHITESLPNPPKH